MAWFWRRRDALKVRWEYTATGQIWRLLPSAVGDFILEERVVDRKEVRFTSLDAETGSVLWTSHEFVDRWWLTIETLHDTTLFLHEYATPDMPDHKRILALGIGDGKRRWSNDEMKFLFADGDAVYAAKDALVGRRFFELSLVTGEILREVDAEDIGTLRASLAEPRMPDIRFPRSPEREGKDGGVTAQELHRLLGEAGAFTGIEYIDAPSFCVIGRFERQRPADPGSPLKHRLSVLHRQNTSVLFDEELDHDLKVEVPDLFFCRGAMLYFVKQKHTLCAVQLPTS